MRTIISLPDAEMHKLDRIARRQRLPRTELIRRAVAAYTQHHAEPDAELFGLWRDRGTDGLAYQLALRGEWPE